MSARSVATPLPACLQHTHAQPVYFRFLLLPGCSIRGQTFGLGTTEIGLNYRKRNGLPVPLVPPMPPGAKQTMQVNFVDPEFTRVMENAAHPLHDATLEFYLHLALNHEVSEYRVWRFLCEARNMEGNLNKRSCHVMIPCG